ncbi:DUF590-domain-containing protein [Rhizoclosmatium globosum]|uniref:DUF590-domain-containing protein n=1 Tax=Rhizoclosmatium globosum TaxID=329046 RepID=A0A1Y2CS07_9FUNG|nr:DUF590-domain-containing protein [Rhizoclosmatium globosum]|eukprot:ORY49753.1 DUF590-domain-containing protein [Rhizoclosmatium globosum]
MSLPPPVLPADPEKGRYGSQRFSTLNVPVSDSEIAALLEREAYGSLPGSWAESQKTDGAIITRHFGPQCVHFFYQDDVALFEEVVEYKNKNPYTDMVQALNVFADRVHADIMVKIVYSNDNTHWDASIEYITKVPSDDPEKRQLEESRSLHRAHFERELLRHHLILVRERGADEISHLRKRHKSTETQLNEEEETGSHYIKVMAGFQSLMKEAEIMKLRMEMIDKEKHLYTKANQQIDNNANQYQASEAHRRAIASHSQKDVFKTVVNDGTEAVDAVITEVKNDVVAIEDAVDNFAVGFKSLVQMAFVLVPVTGAITTHPFDHDILDQFVGGDAKAPRSSPATVQLNFFTTMQRSLMVNIIVNRCNIRLTTVRPMGINDLLVEKVYADYYPIHDGPCWDHSLTERKQVPVDNDRSWLYFNWAKLGFSLAKILPIQPLHKVRNYYGEYVAFYFAWLGFYTVWLVIPAILGLLVSIYSFATSTNGHYFDNAFIIVFAFFQSVWGLLFLRFWSRRNIALATVWNVRTVERIESKRPEFYGTTVKRDPVTGRMETFMPTWNTFRLRFVSYLYMFLAIGLMCAFQFLIIVLHAKFSTYSVYVSTGVSSLFTLINIVVLTPSYLTVSLFLTRSENHKTQLAFDYNRDVKDFVMSALQNYSYLIYVGIFKVFSGNSLDLVGVSKEVCYADAKSGSSCISELMLSMAIVFTGMQFWCQFQAVLLPLVIEKFREASLKRKLAKQHATQSVMNRRQASFRVAPQYILDDVLQVWVRRDEIMPKIIEYGYVCLFSLSFPLAPLLALISSILEIRLGAYRLVVESKRPFARRVEDLGAWKDIMDAIAKISILVNALIIVMSSGYFESTFLANFEDNQSAKLGIQLAFVLIFEHLVILVVGAVCWFVPEEPANIRNSIEREKYLIRVANGEIVEVDDSDIHQTNEMKKSNTVHRIGTSKLI